MHPLYGIYIEKIDHLHQEIFKVLEGLPQEALDWQPEGAANSIAVLAVHTAGAYRYWFTDVILGKVSGRDRAAEFTTRDLAAPAILSRLDASLELVRQALEGLRLEDLAEPRFSQRDQRDYTVGYALLHVLEHTALHLGHMQGMRERWEEREK